MTAVSTITSVHENVTGILKMLLGSSADARPAKVTGCPDPRVVATYVATTGEVLHLLVMGLGVANGVGAALTRIPANRAQEGTKAGNVPEGIRENLDEVLNVCVNCFHEENSGRVVLGKVYLPGEVVEQPILDRITAAKGGTTLDVDLGGYGRGVMLLI